MARLLRVAVHQKALAAMLQAGAIERIGTGLAGRPYRYWRKGR